MIPKIIHYCWFGGKEKPESVQKCIDSWKAMLPDYEIKEWNESNFDYKAYDFTREAYALKKYAFVSDVARLMALHIEGGIYLDTDVIVLKTFDPFLIHKSFIGRETPCILSTAVIGAEAGTLWVKEFLDGYLPRGKHFIHNDGNLSTEPNTMLLSSMITWTWDSRKVELTIYDQDYFCCKSIQTRAIEVTENSVAIHNFEGSWCGNGKGHLSLKERIKNLLIKVQLRLNKNR